MLYLSLSEGNKASYISCVWCMLCLCFFFFFPPSADIHTTLHNLQNCPLCYIRAWSIFTTVIVTQLTMFYFGGQRFLFVEYGFVWLGTGWFCWVWVCLCWVWVCFGQVVVVFFFLQIYLLLGRPTYVLVGYLRSVLSEYGLALVCCWGLGLFSARYDFKT